MHNKTKIAWTVTLTLVIIQEVIRPNDWSFVLKKKKVIKPILTNSGSS